MKKEMSPDVKYIGILDFDNFLFRNYDFNLSDEYLTLEKIVSKEEFSEKYNIDLDKLEYKILLTGRRKSQCFLIYKLLKKGNHKLDSKIFYPINIVDYNNYFNWLKYWKWKGDWILKLSQAISKYLKNYQLIVFDDDKVIFEICNTMQIKCVLINTIEKKSKLYCFGCFENIDDEYYFSDNPYFCIRCYGRKNIK